MLFESSQAPPVMKPSVTWPRYLLLGLFIATIAWLSARWMPIVWSQGLVGAWVLISLTHGLVLAGLWFLTDHHVAGWNANLLLFNPLVGVALIPALHRVAATLYAGGAIVAALFLLLPLHQYNADALALLAPVNLLAAGFLFSNRFRLR